MSGEGEGRRDGRRDVAGAAPRHGVRLAGIPFIIVLLVVLGLGMAAVLVLNTSIQQQESTLEELRAQAQASAYRQDLLQSQVNQLGTTNVLAAKAANLGMVPNPNPVIIQMPEGQIHGTPQAAVGTELPGVAVPSAVPSPTSEISIIASAAPTTANSTQSAATTAAPASPAPSATPTAAPTSTQGSTAGAAEPSTTESH